MPKGIMTIKEWAYKSIKFERDFPILVRTAMGETRGGTRENAKAVMFTILNRLEAQEARYGKTIKEICMKTQGGKHKYAYWGKTKLLHLSYYYIHKLIPVAMEAIDDWINDKDFTNGATHYHAHYVLPYWAIGKTPCYTDTMHRFYNDIN